MPMPCSEYMLIVFTLVLLICDRGRVVIDGGITKLVGEDDEEDEW